VNPSTVGGKWFAHHNNTITWWYVYIPNNAAARGGTYYFVSNSAHSFNLPLTQANHQGQWVSLGFLDVGNNAATRMYNECYPSLAICENFVTTQPRVESSEKKGWMGEGLPPSIPFFRKFSVLPLSSYKTSFIGMMQNITISLCESHKRNSILHTDYAPLFFIFVATSK
jgi:hypothetical protein